MHRTLIGSFSRNPVAWSLLAAFALAEHGNWERGRELSRVCALALHEATYAKSPSDCPAGNRQDMRGARAY